MKPDVIYCRVLDFSGDVKSLDTCWDMALIKDIVEGNVWQPAQGFEYQVLPEFWWKDFKRGVVILPGRQNAKYLDRVQKFIDGLEWVVLIITGDEERDFDYAKLSHERMKVWLMQPRPEDKADFFIGSGYTPQAREHIKAHKADYLFKPLDWSFAGQDNHQRRHEAAEVLERMLDREDMKGSLDLSDGFTKGLKHEDYYKKITGSKAVAAPSGVQSPDSFRLYEALEAGAVPVADDLSTMLIHEPGYWRRIFNEIDVPFKIYDDVANLEGYIGDVVRDYPAYNNRVFGWWQRYKRFMAYKLSEHVQELSGLEYPVNEISHKITVLILTSPIKSHPSTKIIDQTIGDIQKVLPGCEIIIGIDGIRAEQTDYTDRYEKYKKNLLWKTNYEWSNVVPVIFNEHMHQAAMTRELLKMVKTPMMLFVEHDTALAPDFEYDWTKLCKLIETGDAYTIRFHHEAVIPGEHEPMMLGGVEDFDGIPLRKTYQWSQRPHLSSTVFYRDMIDRYFTNESRTMIEDVVHGKVIEDYQNDSMLGWFKWRLWIYHPEGNIKRSYTTDGRGDDPKYEMRF